MDNYDDDVINLTERSLIANILVDDSGNKMLTAVQHIKVEDFKNESNAIIYNAMLDINAKGLAPDTTLLANTLKDNKMLDKIGGPSYIKEILNDLVMTPIEPLIKTIKDHSLLNKFIGKLKEITDKATSEKIDDVSQFIGDSESQINEIAKQRSIKEALSLKEISPMLVQDWVEQTKDMRSRNGKSNGIIGLETGYEALDKLTKGWQKSNMIIIGARPSVGKTAIALQLLYKVAQRNIPVIFFSLEMDSKKIEERLLSLATGLDSTEIHSLNYEPGSVSDKLIINTNGDTEIASKVKKLQAGLKELSKLPFYIDENPGTTMVDIAAKCRKLINGQNIRAGLIAIDYLGLIQAPNNNKDNRQYQVADISRQVKQLSRELKLPIIVLSQLSRDVTKRNVKNKEPQLSDLRDSGALEQDADMVFFLHRDDYYKDINKDSDSEDMDEEDTQKYFEKKNSPISEAKLILRKNRDGATGSVDFIFDKPHCKFSAVTTEYNEES